MGPNWNDQAPTYDRLVFCELEDTKSYLDAIGLERDASVLDVCCGPGRISVAAAERGCHVVGIDSAEKMLERARENAQSHGVADRCDFKLLDWECVLPGQNLERADVVIASRCRAMMDVRKLSGLAKHKVMVQIFADAPSIPALKNVLFDGCGKPFGKPDGPRPKFEGAPPSGPQSGKEAQMQAGPGALPMPGGRPPMPHMWPNEPGHRPGSAYVDVLLKAYDAGYDPNVRIMPERFKNEFETEEQAIDWICSLSPERAEEHKERVALNAEPFLSKTDKGIEFCIATRAAIIWWDVAGFDCRLD